MDETASPTPAPAGLEDILKSLLAPMQEQLTSLASDNKAIKAENESLRQALLEKESEVVPTHLQGDDFPKNPRAARSVVIATRPVMDNPERYNSKSIVDSGSLIRNDASPLSGKNRE